MSASILRLVQLEKTPKGREKLARVKSTRPRNTLAGSHIADLAILGKAIVLTKDEARRFNYRAYNYATNPSLPCVSGYSDASGEWTSEGILFLRKE
jgi:hypothetical protein